MASEAKKVSAPVAVTPAPLTLEELKALHDQSQRSYSDEMINEALRWQLANKASTKDTAEKFGISPQTLANRARAMFKAAGLEVKVTPRAKKTKKAPATEAKAGK